MLRSALVQFSLLCVRYHYNLKELVCYVYSVHNLHSYGELSLCTYFMLSWDTPAEVYKMLLHFDLQQLHHFIIFYYSISQNSTYLTNLQSIILWYLVKQFLLQSNTSKTSQKYRFPTHRKYLRSGIYQGFADSCEVYRDSDLNCLNSKL